MAQVDERLLIQIDAATESLRRQLKQADDSVNRHTRKMDKHLGRVDRAFDRVNKAAGTATRAIGALGLAFGAREIVQFGSRALQTAEDVQRTARSLGTTAATVQELNFAFSEFGADSEDVSDALNTLADRAEDAKAGTKSMVEDFGLLNISVEDLRGKRPDELFELFAQGVAETEDPTRRAAGVVRLLGDDLGRKLLPMLLKGRDGLAELRKEARRTGAVMSDETVKAAEKANAQFRQMRQIIDARFTKAVAENADSFQTLGDAISRIASVSVEALSEFTTLGQQIGTTMAQLSGYSNELDDIDAKIRRLESMRGASSLSRAGLFNFTGEFDTYIDDADIDRYIKQLKKRRAELGGGANVTPPIALDPINVNSPPLRTGGPPRQALKRQVIDVPQRPAISTEYERDLVELDAIRESLKSQEQLINESYDRRIDIVHRSVNDQAEARQMINGLEAQRLKQLEALSGDAYGRMSEYALQAQRNIQDQLGRTLSQTLRGDFDGILDSWSNMIMDMVAQAQAAQLATALLGQDYGSGGKLGGLLGMGASWLGGALGGGVSAASAGQSLADAGIGGSSFGVPSMFAGARADGGPVSSGKTYLVGERGPELFKAPMSGGIVPNHALGQAGGGGAPVNVEIKIAPGLEAVQTRQQPQPGGGMDIGFVVRAVKNSLIEDVHHRGEVSRAYKAEFPALQHKGS